MRFFLLILLALPGILFSQNNRTFFVETGTSMNQSFYPKENLSTDIYPWCGTGNPGSIGIRNSSIERNAGYSFYSKIGIERSIIQKKHFSFSIPFILGYRKQKENYSSDVEEIYYTGETYHYSTKTQDNSEIVSFIFGPKATMNFKKWTFFTSFNMNTDLFFYSQTTTITNNDFGSHKNISSGDDNEILFNVSLQDGLLYNLNTKLSIGLTEDIFFYNFNPDVIKYSKKDNHLFNLGYGTNSTIINTGIRLQYSF